MTQEYAKRFVTKDGNTRISIYYDNDADNPRYNTDEPFHCEDWSSGYSIMNKHERENKSEDARKLLEYLILTGDNCNREKFINALIDNGKKIGNDNVEFGSALVYDRPNRGYILYETSSHYWSTNTKNGWYENGFYDGKKDDIDLCTIIGDVQDETIDWCAQNCLTDKVKIMSYGFGYYGDISFYHEFSTDSEGICWLEKDEFLKYSGCKEEYWNGKSLDEIEFLLDELKAWGDNEVYGYVVEDAVKYKTTRKCLSGNGDDEEYEETEWEEKGLNSCWGYYGHLDKVEDDMFDQAGIDINEFEEENV
jgi:hypothetical protein